MTRQYGVEVALAALGFIRTLPAQTIRAFPIPTADSSPAGIAVGPDGALGFTEQGRIGRITADGVVTEYALPNAFSGPYGIAAGPDVFVNTRDSPRRIEWSLR